MDKTVTSAPVSELEKQLEEAKSNLALAETKLVEAQSDLTEANKTIEELTNNWKRALADYQNLVKRNQSEKGELLAYLSKNLYQRFLPVLDTLMAADKSIDNQGIKLTIKQFEDVLKEAGVNRLETTGKKFNPQTMECVEVIPGKEDDKVAEEIKAGYVFNNDQLLRPALVKVSRKAADKSTEIVGN